METKIRLTSKRGMTAELTEREWAAMEKKFGTRAREMTLTWAARRAEHNAERAGGYTADQQTCDQKTLIFACVRHADDNPPPYDVFDICNRLAHGRPLSAGQNRWLEGVDITESDIESAEAADRSTWKFATRPLVPSVADFYRLNTEGPVPFTAAKIRVAPEWTISLRAIRGDY